jgi:Resolvase, N terminal domain
LGNVAFIHQPLAKTFQSLGIGFISLTECLDSTTAQGKLMFTMLSAFAEFERSMIVERINCGLDRARKQGKKLGRARGYCVEGSHCCLLSGRPQLSVDRRYSGRQRREGSFNRCDLLALKRRPWSRPLTSGSPLIGCSIRPILRIGAEINHFWSSRL